jgi:hypothetical protein
MDDNVSYRLATLRQRSLVDPAYTDLDARRARRVSALARRQARASAIRFPSRPDGDDAA